MEHKIQGVDVKGSNTRKLTKEMLEGIDLEIYPPERLHFLTYALQVGSKLPSQLSMIRSEIRNYMKTGMDTANIVTGRDGSRSGVARRPMRRDVRKAISRRGCGSRIPNRYGPYPVAHPRGKLMRGRGGRRVRGREIMPQPQITFGALQGQPMMPMMGRPIPPMMGTIMPPPMGAILLMRPPPMGAILPMMGPPMGAIPPPPPSMIIPSTTPPSSSAVNIPPFFPAQYKPPPLIQPSCVPPGFVLGGVVNPSMVRTSQVPVKDLKPASVLTEEEIIKARKDKGLPDQIVKKRRFGQQKKQKGNSVKVVSPEELALKSERVIFQKQIEAYRLEWLKERESGLVHKLHPTVPDYFRKKKDSQKRRRLEKHELIKKNKKVLKQIFGNAIFETGWPISRKQIKKALGIQSESETFEELGEFMEQAFHVEEVKSLQKAQTSE